MYYPSLGNVLIHKITSPRGKYEGYCIDSHPLCKCKKFTSIKLTMGEKLTLATEYLEILNNKVAVQRLDGSG